ncbi:hypothetical protein NECAME_10762 [Necator americanus]|uniref:Uncharacterized protein n=1 Tax=Necator americanus TaxID=51031 RepID=W2T7I6_NECAM|nr:hypothetical protein NECAME_10762 [Necator americanus]ETN77813.1 hypothetical protein NECAME_10762 [Necator americanus]
MVATMGTVEEEVDFFRCLEVFSVFDSRITRRRTTIPTIKRHRTIPTISRPHTLIINQHTSREQHIRAKVG